MKRKIWHLCFLLLYLCCSRGNGLAETMYVTDRLYLSFRDSPDLTSPSLTLLPSGTKVEVLQTEGKWAEVILEEGKRGWVVERFLVKRLERSRIVEKLKAEMREKDLALERLRAQNTSLNEEISDLATEAATQAAMKNEIEELRRRITQQNESLEKARDKYRWQNRKTIYGAGFSALLIGLTVGYLVRRPNRNRFYLK